MNPQPSNPELSEECNTQSLTQNQASVWVWFFFQKVDLVRLNFEKHLCVVADAVHA